jgi:hypothetical protein
MCGLCAQKNPGNVPVKHRITEWAEALSSGMYEQTTGRLYRGPKAADAYNRQDENAYCCLGVACLVAEKNGVTIDVDWRQKRVLPVEVRDYFGLPNDNPEFLGKAAAEWNDLLGSNFQTIAALIRNEYLKD